MRKRILGSLAALAAGAGLSYGQPPFPPAGPMGPPPGGPGGLVSPDGRPIISPPGMEGAVPFSSMGTGPGGAYGPGGPGGGGGGGGGYGTGPGVLAGAGGGASRYWFGADYLLWQPKAYLTDLPFLTTSAPGDLGLFGAPSTNGMGTDRNISFGSTPGFRFWGGMAFDEAGTAGLEVGGFILDNRMKSSAFSSNEVGFPLLAVPFFDNSTGLAGSYILSFPGINTGSARIDAETRSWGAEVSAVYNALGGEGAGGMTFFAGGRYFELEEKFSLNTSSSTFGTPPASAGGVFFPGGGGVFAGTDFSAFAPFTVTTSDRIRTFNEFYGANVGFRGETTYGKFTMSLVGKAAAGIVRQRVEIMGESTLTGGGTSSTQQGGLLNGSADLTRARKDRFAILPEGNVNLGYDVTSRFRINVGYNFLYINRVIRPYSVTPQNLNLNQVPVSPTFGSATDAGQRDVFNDTDFFLHGFNFGFQLSF